MEPTSVPETGLAQVLKEQGRRTDWVAESIGVTPSAVSRWASGQWPIPERRVSELAELLGVSEFRIRNGIPDVKENGSLATQRQPDTAEAVKDVPEGTGSSQRPPTGKTPLIVNKAGA